MQDELFIRNTATSVMVAKHAPEKPANTISPTVEALLALADHYRGYSLPNSKKFNSQYRMALEAAKIFVKRKKTLAEVDAVFAYMKGVNAAFCDDWWPMQTVDLWHVAQHFDSIVKRMAHRRGHAGTVSQARQSFQIRDIAELMEMPLAERKIYLSQHREQMQHGER